MKKYVLPFLLGSALTAVGCWLVFGSLAQGAPQATGYTLKQIYDFIVTNGGTDPREGDHSLFPQEAPPEGGMPTLADIMEALRQRLPCHGGGGGALPATGQTKCYSGVEPWDETDCDSADFPGQDGFYQAGCPMEGRFVDNGDGTVTDNCTGLMWQKATAPGTYTWEQALNYCEDLILCNDGTWTTDPDVAAEHGGVKSDDWRLPNVRELESIVDYGRFDPAIDPVFECASSWYWSSSTNVLYAYLAWGVRFTHGDLYDDLRWYRYYVRAVRGGL